jgi:hypothetical protein
MPPTPAADRLRRRAVVLTDLARVLRRLTALTLHLDAGPETWVGPSPQACRDDLVARRALLLQAADGLADEARRFVHMADELDANAGLMAPVR